MTEFLGVLGVAGTWLFVAGLILGFRGHPPPWDWTDKVKSDQEGFEIVLCVAWPITATLMFAIGTFMVSMFIPTFLGHSLRQGWQWVQTRQQRQIERQQRQFEEWDQEEEDATV